MSNLDDNDVVRYMRHLGIEITRENYIAFNWSTIPDPWTAEDEAQLPEELQEKSP